LEELNQPPIKLKYQGERKAIHIDSELTSGFHPNRSCGCSHPYRIGQLQFKGREINAVESESTINLPISRGSATRMVTFTQEGRKLLATSLPFYRGWRSTQLLQRNLFTRFGFLVQKLFSFLQGLNRRAYKRMIKDAVWITSAILVVE